MGFRSASAERQGLAEAVRRGNRMRRQNRAPGTCPKTPEK